MICAHCCFKAVFLLHVIPINIRSWNSHPCFIVNNLLTYCVHRCLLLCYGFNKTAWQVLLLVLFCSKRVKVCNICVNITNCTSNTSRWILWFHLHDIMFLKTQCTTVWIKMYCLQSANVINTFTAIVDLSWFNNSCLKSPASTLVDLTFQSRALHSFSLNQLRNLSL